MRARLTAKREGHSSLIPGQIHLCHLPAHLLAPATSGLGLGSQTTAASQDQGSMEPHGLGVPVFPVLGLS